eukprot:SAG31_NODE_22028_length_535_cov_1.094037_1_plen_134_part_00
MAEAQSPATGDAVAEALEGVRSDLAGMKLSGLKKMALSTPGIQPGSVAGVDDFDDPKAELISLLMAVREQELRKETLCVQEAALKTLRDELSAQKLSTLKLRAVADGLGKKLLSRFCAHYSRNTGLSSRDATH